MAEIAGHRVQVAVRLRPFASRERSQAQAAIIDGNTVRLKILTAQLAARPKEEEKLFTFDHCFSSVAPGSAGRRDPNPAPVGQEQVYESIGHHLLGSALEGFNGSLFAYGQTGSGKTHTVLGHDKDPGLVPRLTRQLFSEERVLSSEPRVSASFLEIYNEQLKDLLNPEQKRRKQLFVHQHPQLGVYVPHLTEATVTSHSECMGLLDFGSKIRATSQTNMNSVSSRSHALFILRIAVSIQDGGVQRIRSSTLNLIDLAGSERVKKSGAEGQRMREGQNINSSLSVLGQVISKLADGKDKHKHVPFRQSKLTYLLMDALSGNSRTLMVAAISPSASEAEETLGTLRFASSVKKIRTVAVQNEQEVVERDLMVQTIRSEIDEMRELAKQLLPESPEARRLRASADAVELGVRSVQTRLHEMEWGEARRVQGELESQRCETLKSMSLSLSICGALGGAAGSRDDDGESSPYLLNVSDDISLSGKLIYFLHQDQACSVGADPRNRIHLVGLGIVSHLCELWVNEGNLSVEIRHANRGGRLVVDGFALGDGERRTLQHGARITFGRAFVFRVVIPASPQAIADEGGEFVVDDPRPAEGADSGEEWLMELMDKSVTASLSDEVRDRVLRTARELRNLVDEANEILRELEQGCQFEVGLLLRPRRVICKVGPEVTMRPDALRARLASQSFPDPQLVVHVCRDDGEVDAVWPAAKFSPCLEELRDQYQEAVESRRNAGAADHISVLDGGGLYSLSPSPPSSANGGDDIIGASDDI